MFEVRIPDLKNPFSFFCFLSDDYTEAQVHVEQCDKTTEPGHGQYVAVLWENKWVRGIVSKENHFVIWLVDYGIYVHHSDKMVYMHLPSDCKNLPSKVFEASIHGVVPVEKVVTDDCKLSNSPSMIWTPAAITCAWEAIQSAKRISCVPVSILSTKENDIVLGDFYLEIPGEGTLNLVDILESWPGFLKKNSEEYIKRLPVFYSTRRRHRACVLKPNLPGLPAMSLATTLMEYSAICSKTPQLEADMPKGANNAVDSPEGSTVVGYKVTKKNENKYDLTPAEIEQYSNLYINLNGNEHNVLNLILNKVKDLNMCKKYQNYDQKGIGRGTSRQ